jgi:hypothetical protein
MVIGGRSSFSSFFPFFSPFFFLAKQGTNGMGVESVRVGPQVHVG